MSPAAPLFGDSESIPAGFLPQVIIALKVRMVFHQILTSPVVHDASGLHDHDSIGRDDRADSVCDDDHHHVSSSLFSCQSFANFLFGDQIQRRRRFAQHERRWAVESGLAPERFVDIGHH